MFMFDKPIPEGFKMPSINCLCFGLTKWVEEKDMTEEEKESNPTYTTTGGYLKVKGYKEAFTESLMAAPLEELKQIQQLPNFDPEIFMNISGCELIALILSKS